jgi:predicted nucleotidyltransferase
MKFGLSEADFAILEKVAIQPLKAHGCRVWIFGSRARGNFKPFSDIDLLYEESSHPLPAGLRGQILENLEESRLNFKVDLVNSSEAAKSYLPGILKDRIEL